jgi:hypothetical protein
MSNSVDTNNVSKLTLAAEELIKAASAHVETTSIALGQETVQDLKKILNASSRLDSKFDTLNQKVSTLEQNTTGKISEMNAQMMLYLDKMNKNISLQMKHQRLDWAFTHSDYGSFEYHEMSKYGNLQSSALIKSIVSSFRQGLGRHITNFFIYTGGKSDKAAFHTAIVDQLFGLLGTKPRVVQQEEKWIIYYE